MRATRTHSLRRRLLHRSLVGFVALLAMIAGGLGIAHAAEIVPSVGIVRVADDADAKVFAGLALRGQIAPLLMSEIGVGYRSEDRFDDRLHVRMWPVTGSLYLTPLPAVYAGAGVGWYHVTHDYDQDLLPLVEDETSQEFGVHVGGGLRVPLAPSAGLDLGGRYVMMREQDNRLVPERFDPDFWMTSIGLSLRF